MGLNLACTLVSSARYFPDEPALIHDDQRLSYVELAHHVAKLARRLEDLGIRPGDRVVLYSPNRMGYTIGYFGVLHIGAVAVPVHHLVTATELLAIAKDCTATAAIAWRDLAGPARDVLRHAPSVRQLLVFDASAGPFTLPEDAPAEAPGERLIESTPADATAVILYTSGTTGAPKGVELTHLNLFANAQFYAHRIRGRAGANPLGPGDVLLAALPLSHAFGQSAVQNAAISAGAAVSFLDRFTGAGALEVLRRDGVTYLAGVPTMYFRLLHESAGPRVRLPALRTCIAGGAPFPGDLREAFEARHGAAILEGYGLTETSPLVSTNVPWRPRKVGSVGLPIPGCDVRIVGLRGNALAPGQAGEIIVRGHNVMRGYHGRPEETAKVLGEGWLHTGDIGYLDGDGYLYIVDRKSDLIIRGGYNVYPREVEDILHTHPAVQEASVVGVPDPEYGEEVKAFVSLVRGAQLEPQDLLRYCRERLSTTKCPRLMEILGDLPKGPTGKVLRRKLRERGR